REKRQKIVNPEQADEPSLRIDHRQIDVRMVDDFARGIADRVVFPDRSRIGSHDAGAGHATMFTLCLGAARLARSSCPQTIAVMACSLPSRGQALRAMAPMFRTG